jgi:tRNA splicing ligase
MRKSYALAILKSALTFLFLTLFITNKINAQTSFGKNDTIVRVAVIYEGDTIEAKVLPGVYVWGYEKNMSSKAKWTRLRNAVYVTYPYARRAAFIFNDINRHISVMDNKTEIRKYINTREKELKKEFTDPLTNLSVYQGKVLMKLINRETKGNNCYDIVKELKGGFTARFWQTVAFFFGSSLKQPYDAKGNDAEIERYVKEVQRMYGYAG